MSGNAVAKLYMSYAEFVAFEEKSEAKHEWLDGVVYDMAGGTFEHARLELAIGSSLLTQVRGKRCIAFSSNLAIRVLATGLLTYPDVGVICGPLEKDPEHRNAGTNPTVIVEVLSDSTEAYDRGEKFAPYRRIPSLMEYVLVSQHKARIEVFRKQVDETWAFSEVLAGQTLRLGSIECELSVDDIYAGSLADL